MRKSVAIKRGFRWKRLVLLVPLIVLGAFIWWGILQASQAGRKWLAGTPWSLLERIEVRGLNRLPEHDIICAAKVKLGENLMEIETDSIAARVTVLEPVLETSVFRRFPRRLVIRVVEREPIAGIGNGNLQLIDEYGVTFLPVCGGEVLDLPIITGDFRQKTDTEGFRLAFNLLQNIIEEYPAIYNQLGEINCSKGKLSIRLKQGGALVMTNNPGCDEVLVALDTFLSQKNDELPAGIDYVNMLYPAMIITGKRGSN